MDGKPLTLEEFRLIFEQQIKIQEPVPVISKLTGTSIYEGTNCPFALSSNGRLGFYFATTMNDKYSPIIIDLFSGNIRVFSIARDSKNPETYDISSPKFISDDRIVFLRKQKRDSLEMVLFNIDYKKRKFMLAGSVLLYKWKKTRRRWKKIRKTKRPYLVFDENDKNKFVIMLNHCSFLVGHLTGDQIVVNLTVRYLEKGLHGVKMENDHLYGLLNMAQQWEAFVYDLNGNLVKSAYLQCPSFNRINLHNSLKPGKWIWSGEKLLVVENFKSFYASRIFSIDLTAENVTDTNFCATGRDRCLAVNEHGVFTIASDLDHEFNYNVIRVPTRKPDSLLNIAWFAHRRNATKLIEKYVRKLPLNGSLEFFVNRFYKTKPNCPC